MLNEKAEIFAGIDTHKKTYAVATCDVHGKILNKREFSTSAKGIKALKQWLFSEGEILAVGIEGTGCYGKNATIALQEEGLTVIEVNHACKKTRRSKGKSDELDSENAALTARDCTYGGVRDCNGCVAIDRTSELEEIRIIKSSYDAAMTARTQAINELRATVLKAQPGLRSQLEGFKSGKKLAEKCSRLRPHQGETRDRLTKIALKNTAKLYLELTQTINEYRELLEEFAGEHLKNLLELKHVGALIAVQMFLSAGANIERFKNDGAFAAHCGTAPIPASSGQSYHMRLSRAGDRKANCAIYQIAIGRMHTDKRTKKFIEKKMGEGKTKKDAIRCLKRYITREVFAALKKDAKLF